MAAMPTSRPPDDWKGSDLTSRAEVVRYLTERGGIVTDKSGLLAGTMARELGRGRAFSQLLAEMEKDGMIQREVKGRRTLLIRLVDDWGLLDNMPTKASLPPRQRDVRRRLDDLEARLARVEAKLATAEAHRAEQ